jgi:hypothetical protein
MLATHNESSERETLLTPVQTETEIVRVWKKVNKEIILNVTYKYLSTYVQSTGLMDGRLLACLT